MKLSIIKSEHIKEAVNQIDSDGIDSSYLSNNYWVEVNGHEYPFKYLTRLALKIAQGDNSLPQIEFQSNDSYRNYIRSLGFEIKYYREGLSFISKKEIQHYRALAGKSYRKSKIENVKDGVKLKSLAHKVDKWSELSVVEDYQTKSNKSWHWSGTFKKYLWHKIFKSGDSGLVYFVVGVGEEGELFIDLQCQTSNHTQGKVKGLPPEKILAFNNHKASSTHTGIIIPTENVDSYDWNSLISITQNHIYRFSDLYDELESLIKDTIQFEDKNETSNIKLRENNPPSNTKSYASKQRDFKGFKVDWTKKHFSSQSIGCGGEELVLLSEKEKIKKWGLNKQGFEVEKKQDGEGYDILSYDEFGNKKFIEVKTTPKGIDEPFYISFNEIEFCKEYHQNYWIYRLYNFNSINNTSDFYVISGEELLENYNITALTFEISKKDIN